MSLGSCIFFCSWAFIVCVPAQSSFMSAHNNVRFLGVSFLPLRWQKSLWLAVLVSGCASQPPLPGGSLHFCPSCSFFKDMPSPASSFPSKTSSRILLTCSRFLLPWNPFSLHQFLSFFLQEVWTPSRCTLPFAFPFSSTSSCLEPMPEHLAVHYWWSWTKC